MKVYVQMDYLSSLGTDYLSASYRDFVPEAIEIREVIGEHLKAVVRRSERIMEISRGIANLEKIAAQPIRTYIEHQIEEGFAKTPSYFVLRERGLHVRKQTFLQYWHAIEEGWREEPEPEEEEEAPEEYDDSALTAIHEWLTKELQRAFSGWGIDSDYDIFIAEEFTATYKTRTFEFGLIRSARVHKDDVPVEETYYFLVYNEGKVKSYEMWSSHINPETGRRTGVDFDYMGFNMLMHRLGAWE